MDREFDNPAYQYKRAEALRARAEAAEARVAEVESERAYGLEVIRQHAETIRQTTKRAEAAETRVAELESKLATYEGTNLIAQVAGVTPGKAQAAVIDALKATLDTSQARVAELEELLRRALSESHHTDKCPVRYREPCTCWHAAAAALTSKEPTDV